MQVGVSRCISRTCCIDGWAISVYLGISRCLSAACCIDGWLRSGNASITTDASASMNSGSSPRVGTRMNERTPLEAARAAYLHKLHELQELQKL